MGYAFIAVLLAGLWAATPETLWLLLPILAANQHGYAKRLFGGDTPTYEPIFGKGKTWGALYLGPLHGAVAVFLEWCFAPWISLHFGVLYLTEALSTGLILGCAVVAGDHLKSAIKHSRWVNKPQGAQWFLDRVDWAISGSLAGFFWLNNVAWWQPLVIILLAWPIHFIGNKNSHRYGWRDVPH